MKLRNDGGQSADEPSGTPHYLQQISYSIAYHILPDVAHKHFHPQVINDWKNNSALMTALYRDACEMGKVAPDENDLSRFRMHRGSLDEVHDYFVMQYPRPPEDADPALPAPYFTAIVRHAKTGTVRYFTLGKLPMAPCTTFREVTAAGRNCNLGPGPDAELPALLGHLRGGVIAAPQGDAEAAQPETPAAPASRTPAPRPMRPAASRPTFRRPAAPDSLDVILRLLPFLAAAGVWYGLQRWIFGPEPMGTIGSKNLLIVAAEFLLFLACMLVCGLICAKVWPEAAPETATPAPQKPRRPARAPKPAEQQAKGANLSPEQAAALLAAFPEQVRPAVQRALEAGLTDEESLYLQLGGAPDAAARDRVQGLNMLAQRLAARAPEDADILFNYCFSDAMIADEPEKEALAFMMSLAGSAFVTDGHYALALPYFERASKFIKAQGLEQKAERLIGDLKRFTEHLELVKTSHKMTRSDNGYVHSGARMSFSFPPQWRVILHDNENPDERNGEVRLHFSQPDVKLNAIISLFPLVLNEPHESSPETRHPAIDELKDEEFKFLRTVYGAEKIGRARPIKTSYAHGHGFEVLDGPNRDGKERMTISVLCIEDRLSWKFRIQVAYSLGAKPEALEQLFALINSFQRIPQSGPEASLSR